MTVDMSKVREDLSRAMRQVLGIYRMDVKSGNFRRYGYNDQDVTHRVAATRREIESIMLIADLSCITDFPEYNEGEKVLEELKKYET
jgi:hypothetical protein